MRDLSELEMFQLPDHECPPLTAELVAQFELDFNLKLPDEYIEFLRFSNGGHPNLRWISNELDVPWFYSMAGEGVRGDEMWQNKRLLSWLLKDKDVPFADDQSELTYILDCACNPSPVLVVSLEDRFNFVKLADSFSDFLDLLKPVPDEDE